jgi:DNA-binding beta-propeller fold protein YncE
LLVTDTGNKRVQVFDQDGNFVAQFGSPGSGEGQLNEPVGLAVDANGNIYVADTWNKRIQVFDPNFNFVRQWLVAAWEQMDQSSLQAIDHKPYLAIEDNTLYVTSPRTAQVLAYTLSGTPIELPSITFGAEDLPTGVKAQGGGLFVTNQRNGAVLEFSLATNPQ